MGMRMSTTRWVSTVVVAVIIGFVAHFAQGNLQCRARLSLLTKGYLNVELKDPDHSTEGVSPHIFVSKLVYAQKEYLGYIDPYGHFVPKSEQGIDLVREGRIMTCLSALQMICGAIFLIGIMCILMRARRQLVVAHGK